MTTLGVYLEVPFCRTKCTYCNFSSNVFPRSLLQPYANAVSQEILYARDLYRRSELTPAVLDLLVDTVYLGGGTPSLLDDELLAMILAALHGSLQFCREQEVTLEASPASVTPEKALAWRRLGINRLSLGVQSLNDTELRAVGRLDRRADIIAAVDAARQSGFANLSLDLIVGLPGQSEASWTTTLDAAARLEPQHVSLYMLEIDDGSRLGREALAGGARYGARNLPEDDSIADWYQIAVERLAALGFEQYEISNFARSGFSSRHNLKYWTHQPYVGFGAGAHSFDGRARWANVDSPEAYSQALAGGSLAVAYCHRLSQEELLEEEFFLGLRMRAGVEFESLRARYGEWAAERYESTIERFAGLGLLRRIDGRVRLTPAALPVANEVLAEFVG